MTSGTINPLSLPYGDPNQPYDRLPGTLETYHVKWARPLAAGKLKVLVIIPYMNARQVVELAQRLDVDYTAIMCAGQALWSQGRYEGTSTTSIYGPDAEILLRKLSHDRLGSDKRYDAIVIAKVSWEAIPRDVRGMILTHVERGTGLVYVSPNRIKEGLQTPDEVDEPNPQFDALFRVNEDVAAALIITAALPMDLLPFKLVADGEAFAGLPPIRCNEGSYPHQTAVSIRVSHHGTGSVVSLDYFDSKWGRNRPFSLGPMMSPESCHYPMPGIGNHNSLSPEIIYDDVVYDYSFALLARCVLYSTGRRAPIAAAVSFEAPPTEFALPVEDTLKDYRWRVNRPRIVIARDDLPAAKALLKVTAPDGLVEPVRLDYSIRSSEGDVHHVGEADGPGAVDIPVLQRGDYTFDLRVLNGKGQVLEFISTSFRVDDFTRIKEIETDKDAYEKGEIIRGRVSFTRSLSSAQSAVVRAVDTWGRTVFRTQVTMDSQGVAGTFSIPVELPLCRLWDIHCAVCDAEGEVDSAKVWVGLPDWNFDEYIWALIFAPHPEHDWKGRLYAEVIRPYGVNATNAYLICGDAKLFECELNERYHLHSIGYAENHGSEAGGSQFEKRQQAVADWLGAPRAIADHDIECSDSCPAQFGRMARQIADTGEPLDGEAFPYKAGFGTWLLDAGRINDRARSYLESAKFGVPYYWLCGEAYLWGEGQQGAKENSCFCPLCTKNFQTWSRQQFNHDLAALNCEWGSDFTAWDQVRGILYNDAAQKEQLPRWVDFRHFMRSRVWSQFFIDWTDMVRRWVPQARTGYNGHDHYDLSRFRNHMTSGKMYITPVEIDCEWRFAAMEELHQSFSGDKSFLVGANSMIRWHNDFDDPIERKRSPWKMLFAGYRGFDWEEGLSFQTLGGSNCFTPDYSEALPFFKDLSDEVRYLQCGVAKLVNTAKPKRDPIAILWAPYNHYISRLYPFEDNGFTGTELYNTVVDHGAITDCLALLKSLRLRGTFVAPEDLDDGALDTRGFKALLLPYNKGMSQSNADAIHAFVENGGLVIADNNPGLCSEHGRELDTPRLADLFRETANEQVIRFGKGAAAYLPNGINHYLGQMERGEYANADAVAVLLREFTGVTPTVELIGANGIPRRDTLTPLYLKGSALYVGMLRNSLSADMESAETTVRLMNKHHVWDVREHRYFGFVDTFSIDLDMRARFFALLPGNPVGFNLDPADTTVSQGESLRFNAMVEFDGGKAEQIARMGQVAHVEVFAPTGEALECYRDNVLFAGPEFEIALPISYSEKPGRYTLKAEYVVTGMIAKAEFEVRER